MTAFEWHFSDEGAFENLAKKTWALPAGFGRLFWQAPADRPAEGAACFLCRLPAGFVEVPHEDDFVMSALGITGMAAGINEQSVHHPVIFFGFRFDFIAKPPICAREAFNPADPDHHAFMRRFIKGPKSLNVGLLGSQAKNEMRFSMPIPEGHQIKLQQLLDGFDARKRPSAVDFESFAREVYAADERQLRKTLYDL